MSETMIAKDHEIKEKKEKEIKVKPKDEAPDPYCCTPGGGSTGPDTKP
jgi:hypothetical protein